MEQTIVKYTAHDAARIDKELHQLSAVYSSAKIKLGLEIGLRLKEIDDNNLYRKLDETAYPNFYKYVESIGMSYQSARQLISLYESYVLAGGFTIEELTRIPYSKLTVIKAQLFEKKDNQYRLAIGKDEARQWLSDAKSDMTIADLKQKRAEVNAGEHAHVWKHVEFDVCETCNIKQFKDGRHTTTKGTMVGGQ
jgi:hypothetical protein